jgi:hypothetical protein
MPFVPLTLILLQIVAGAGPLAEPAAQDALPNVRHRLEPAQALTVTYAEAHRHKLDQARLTAASVDDFDGDGALDLVCGHAGPSGYSLTLQRGNADAIQPNAPEARERRERGELVDQPFHQAARVFDLLERPDFVASGDFVREPGYREELALLSESGEVQIAKLERLASAEARGTALPVVAEIGARRGRAERRTIVTGRVSGQPVEDLLIIGGEADQLIVLTEIPTRLPTRSVFPPTTTQLVARPRARRIFSRPTATAA